MTQARLALGRRGEALAEAFLLGLGMRIRDRNFRVRGGPELDLVAEHEGTLVFVEVRTRSKRDGFAPLDSVDRDKQQNVRRAARSWLRAAGWNRDQPVRIDVVGVVFDEHGARLVHLEDAF
jgi:putative endonuclease